MPISIQNTLSRTKEEFIPLHPPHVTVYSCGVTVYDECHIGHARSLYIFDVIRRYLRYRDFDVEFVRNITDIDDKIINRAQELKIDWRELVSRCIAGYYEDLRALGIDKADWEPRATENIGEMITAIQTLIDKGFAYRAKNGVYFSVRKCPGYGALSNQSIDEMHSATRIEPDEGKHDLLDFALWKNSKPGEPFWPSPWGEGRPGWHIECSVMSRKFLKTDTLDIHAGGLDLIFPHHVNEVAQSEALTGKPFAKYWIHHGLLTINAQKMSKSLGNFVTIKDALKKYNPDVLKLFFLQAHYSSPIDYSEKKMEEATKAYEGIINLKKKIEQKYGATVLDPRGADFIAPFKVQFTAYMDDDFNTPRGLSVLFDMIKKCNIAMEDTANPLRDYTLRYALEMLKEIAGIFGLTFIETASKETSDAQVAEQIASRAAYKKQKKFKEADDIRKNLEAKGIILEDTKDGTTWRRKL